MSKLRIGFVGCGSHAVNSIMSSLRFSPIDLAWVCDLREDRRNNAARWFGAERTFDDYRTALRDAGDIGAVFVVGPPSLHHEVALAALEQGLPVFMEKPPGDNLQQAREIQAASRAVGKPVMVAFMKRFGLAYRKAKELMSAPEFGKPTYIEAKYCHWNTPNPHRHLIFMSAHPLDLVRYFMGDIKRLHFRRAEHDGQLSFALSYEFESGAVGTLAATAQQPRVQERVELCGQGMLIRVDNLVNIEVIRGVGGIGPEVAMDEIQTWRPDFAIPSERQNSLFLQGYAGEVREFAEAVLAGREPSPNIEDGVKAMEIVELLENSQPGEYVYDKDQGLWVAD